MGMWRACYSNIREKKILKKEWRWRKPRMRHLDKARGVGKGGHCGARAEAEAVQAGGEADAGADERIVKASGVAEAGGGP
eukprot:scaffold2609_cov123-Isochrysis_galbana.AAC.6